MILDLLSVEPVDKVTKDMEIHFFVSEFHALRICVGRITELVIESGVEEGRIVGDDVLVDVEWFAAGANLNDDEGLRGSAIVCQLCTVCANLELYSREVKNGSIAFRTGKT